VAVVGSPGAGKTTFAVQLSRRTGLPVVHLDRLYWKPGWTPTSSEMWPAVVEDALVGERWIVDGNYAGTFDVRFERADTIIVLAKSRLRCTLRVGRRTLANFGRPVQAVDCPERFDPQFLRWVWRFPKDSRPLLDGAIARHAHSSTVVELRSSAQVRAFLDGMRA
jgi:adenylate kinase family enzyme